MIVFSESFPAQKLLTILLCNPAMFLRGSHGPPGQHVMLSIRAGKWGKILVFQRLICKLYLRLAGI